jgi:uncharacterized Fe-S cluster-containing radical SAM superfamily protein
MTDGVGRLAAGGPYIPTDKYALELRGRSILGTDRFLVTKFPGSLQEKDITDGPNCEGYGRVHHFPYDRGPNWVVDPLPQQVAAWRLGEIAPEIGRAQVFQNASCNWRCWYCFVDFGLLSAVNKWADFKSADELLDLFLKEPDRPRIIDLSGGQPDIIPEWPIRMMEAIQRRNLEDEYFLWMDDNLSVYFAWDYLTPSDFKLMKSFRNFGRVGCFKGFSPSSFTENTNASPDLFERQIDIMSRWVKMGLDMYGYITLTASNLGGMHEALRLFMDSIQKKVCHYFPLRTVPLQVRQFTPTRTRMKEREERAMKNQFEILGAWSDELNARYSKRERNLPIYNVSLS